MAPPPPSTGVTRFLFLSPFFLLYFPYFLPVSSFISPFHSSYLFIHLPLLTFSSCPFPLSPLFTFHSVIPLIPLPSSPSFTHTNSSLPHFKHLSIPFYHHLQHHTLSPPTCPLHSTPPAHPPPPCRPSPLDRIIHGQVFSISIADSDNRWVQAGCDNKLTPRR